MKRFLKNHIIFPAILFLSIQLHGQELLSVEIENVSLNYYLIKTEKNIDGKLLIFLHGSVSQYQQLKTPLSPPISQLLENNDAFTEVFTNHGYDIIFPIAFNQYNWLDSSGSVPVDEIIDQYSYNEIVIAGFSDGGTGAYRYFYYTPEKFDGLLIFNGFPQHDNYNKKVDYNRISNKSIAYISTDKDKVIPYEFLLVEYRKQKMVNKNTFFLLRKGKHWFGEYKSADFKLCIEMLGSLPETEEVQDGEMLCYPSIDGLIINDELRELYPFRKKTGKSYSMNEEAYKRTDYSYKTLDKWLKSNSNPKVFPSIITREVINSDMTIEFEAVINNQKEILILNNWNLKETWPAIK